MTESRRVRKANPLVLKGPDSSKELKGSEELNEKHAATLRETIYKDLKKDGTVVPSDPDLGFLYHAKDYEFKSEQIDSIIANTPRGNIPQIKDPVAEVEKILARTKDREEIRTTKLKLHNLQED